MGIDVGDKVTLDADNDQAAMTLFGHFNGTYGTVLARTEGGHLTVRFEDGVTDTGHESWFAKVEDED